MKSPNWIQFGPNVDNSSDSLDNMYDNIIARDKSSNNTNIKETKSSLLGTNKCLTNANHRTISDENNKRSILHSNLSLDLSNEKKRPLSISSVSSSSSSSCSSLTRNGSYGLGDTKKSYLASIESLDDADEDTDDDSLGIIRMIRAKVNGCGSLSAATFQGGSVNQQSHHSSQSQSLQPNSNHSNSQTVHEQQTQPHTKSSVSVVNNITCRNGTLPKYLDTNLSHIDRVIVEIVETERTYVKDLQEIIEGYLKHMKSLEESKINKEEISNLFSNIEDIYKFNSNFFSQLDECGLNAVSIAKCFIQNSSGFNIYTHYCTNYPRTVSLLTEMMRNSDRAELFKERQLCLKHSLPLGSYLLKPVQRILKYHLLLQNIVKYTDKETNDYFDIKNALSVMTNIAYHINDMKRKHEHAVRVQEIQSLLYNWEGQDLTTYGDLQCEGSFRMFGAKAYRHLFLFDKMLLITKKKDEGILSYKTHILCSNLMLIESIQGEPLCFHAIPFDQPRAQYTFQARNLEQKREWCLLLKRVILENYNVVIPSHAKQIVMELGQSIHCVNQKGHSGSKRTLSAPEYLERRKQERRKSESTVNQNLSKGFKLRKSLKKIHHIDGNNGSRRARSSSHDESVRTLSKHEENSERRASLGIMERINSKNANISGEKFESNAINELTTTPPKPVDNQTGSATNTLTEEKATNDLENQIDLSNNILDMRPPPRTFRIGQKQCNINNDSNGEYVTFYISANNQLEINEDKCSNYLNRTSTPLSSGSSELSMASSSQSEDSKYVVLPVNALFSYTSHVSNSPIVRRVQSFTGMTRAKAILQHTLSLRHSLTSDLPPTSPNKRINERPNTLNLSNCSSSSQLPTSSSLDEMSPTAPAIWLKRQEQHFASSVCKKGGSLPRSFESTSFSESNQTNSNTSPSNRSRHTPHSDQCRPFTIAADKPLNADFSDGSLERYIDMENENQCLKSSSSHDDILKCSDSSHSISLENVSSNEVHHPEHKIYKHSASKYIRSMIYSVSSKLVSLRKSPTNSDHGGDNSSVISGESIDRCDSPSLQNRSNSRTSNKANESKHEVSPKLITARFVHTLAKAYSNIIKNKLKSSAKNEIDISMSKTLAEIPSPVFARIAMPTNSSVAAARLAAYDDNEDCFTPKHRCGQHNKLSNSRQRPDSLLSEASNVSLSSEGTERSVLSGNSFSSDFSSFENKHNEHNVPLNSNLNDDSPSDASDSSIDSFYERTFEAIESALAEEMFGDSAIYSDHDDNDISSTNGNQDYIDNHLGSISSINIANKDSIYKSIEHLKCVNLNLNLMSAKRVKGAIIEKLKVLEENARFQKDMNVNDFDGIKTIKERMKELEKWCSNKENCDENDCSDDEQYSNCSPKGSPKPNSKGWVKHVIGKLQNDGQQQS